MSELFQIRTRQTPPPGHIALFDLGLRPFFLGAGLYGAASLLWWVLVYTGRIAPAAGWPAQLQHSHEMVFGFGGAAVGGFLLTAVPSWTGSKPIQGLRLGTLSAIWLLGRIAFHVPELPGALLAALDVAFLPALLTTLWPALKSGKRKNLSFAAWLTVLSAANLGSHLSMLGFSVGGLTPYSRTGVYALVMLIAILMGRVVPGFTRNALRLQGKDHETTTNSRIELGAKSSALLTLSADVFALPPQAVGGLALLAAILFLARMARWRTSQIWTQPIVCILHVGHLWLVLGFAMLALERLTPLIPPGASLHAFTAGLIGTAILAIMTRAALGHTGRPLQVSPVTVASYLLVTVGSLTRTLGPILLPTAYPELITIAGCAWSLSFILFVIIYAPILIGPRADGL